MTRLEYACFQANPDCEMVADIGLDGKEWPRAAVSGVEISQRSNP
jgi:hypothetical protein